MFDAIKDIANARLKKKKEREDLEKALPVKSEEWLDSENYELKDPNADEKRLDWAKSRAARYKMRDLSK